MNTTLLRQGGGVHYEGKKKSRSLGVVKTKSSFKCLNHLKRQLKKQTKDQFGDQHSNLQSTCILNKLINEEV